MSPSYDSFEALNAQLRNERQWSQARRRGQITAWCTCKRSTWPDTVTCTRDLEQGRQAEERRSGRAAGVARLRQPIADRENAS